MDKERPYINFFKGKRVTLMGLGVLGRGIGDARFLAKLGAELIVTDLKTKEELADSLSELKEFSNITYHLGGHKPEDFKDRDMVIKAAGVPLDSAFIADAKKNGVPVYMSTALFAKFAAEAGATMVGVTGTRGKSTVSHLIYHALKTAGKPVHLGGNVRGLSTLEMLPEIKAGDLVVLELDSWQLQGFGDLKISPHIAVFTNLLDDHLNYYKGDIEAYFWDKANIFTHQKNGDPSRQGRAEADKLIAGAQVLGRIQSANPPSAPLVPPPLPEGVRLQLVGEHNRQNAALAALALRMLGLSDAEIKKGLETFQPVEGRLQKVANIGDVVFYNDNNSTTPDATIAALDSFEGSKLALIVGGADKQLDLAMLAEKINALETEVLLLPGSGTERLMPMLTKFTEVSSMQDAVAKAYATTRGDGVVLFSPGFASFGMFKNEYDRNDQFLAAVKALS